MGGIKNREQKMKMNKICASGAGGGSKGPSTIDKRGTVEFKCPHCDKIYQNSGRLKEHVASKHADQEPPASSSSSLSSQALSTTTSSMKSSQSSSKNPSSLTNASSAKSSSSSSAAGLQQPAPAGSGMMDIGSKAGYYTSKSPKLQLLEWCQKDNKPNARYNARRAEGGDGWSCKVVLPDPKRNENDQVIFLPQELAAPDAWEAEQRAAVAALHFIAGNRQLEMVLPQQYRFVWRHVKEVAEKRKEVSAARQEKEIQRRDKVKAIKARLNTQGPKLVVMSELKQELIRSMLNERYGHLILRIVPVFPNQGEIEELLCKEGFDRDQVSRAVRSSAGQRTSNQELRVDDVRDWLFILLAENELPMQFRAASRSNAVTVIARGALSGSNIEEEEEEEEEEVEDDEEDEDEARGSDDDKMETNQQDDDEELTSFRPSAYSSHKPLLLSCGYTPADCRWALAASQGDEHSALWSLFHKLTGVLLGPTSSLPEGWEEEFMVLSAIYGEDAVSNDSGLEGFSSISLKLPLPETLLSFGAEKKMLFLSGFEAEDQPLLHLAFVLGSPEGTQLVYPSSPPLILVTCSVLRPVIIRRMTRRLTSVAVAASSRGEPMLHDLVTAAMEMMSGEWHKVAQQGVLARLPLEESSGDEGSLAIQGRNAKEAKVGSAVRAEDRREPVTIQDQHDNEVTDQRGDEEEEEAALEAATLSEGFDGLSIEATRDESLPLDDPRASGADSSSQHNKSGHKGGLNPRAAHPRGPSRLSAAQAESESKLLYQHHQTLEGSVEHERMRRQRSALPAASQKEELLTLLEKNGILVVSGATGCGKSTQVPQYILEREILSGKGADCNIIVTQPRRISALGLASRVAAERREEVGGTVGYSVRLDTKSSLRTRLLFCTTGVLLRRLLNDPSLDCVSHVVLDEVHERSVEIDLLLLLLRDVASRRSLPKGRPLHLVLMSATADADSFSSYMAQSGLSVGMITIPGFTFPIREYYLEEILEQTGHVIGRSSRFAKKVVKEDASWEPHPDAPAESCYGDLTRKSMTYVDEGQVNYEAMVDLSCLLIDQQRQMGSQAFLHDWPAASQYLANKGLPTGGAVLIFLPGAPEISRLMRLMTSSDKLLVAAGGKGCLWVLPLHGSLSSADQARVFNRPPKGVTKIVLATNVAETSITIDDVSFVVDSGRAKEMSHDVERSIMRLQEEWISQAAAQQRRGRAGRVRPGVVFRMFSRSQWASMPNHTSPEMLRSPLERVAMLIKGMCSDDSAKGLLDVARGSGGISRVLSQCLSPPLPSATANAVKSLIQIGAFSSNESLSSLGHHLNQMPMDARVGKMLVYAALLGCLDPILTIAAALAHGRPIFLSQATSQQDLDVMRRAILEPAVKTRSDHIALVTAFNGWVQKRGKGGRMAGTEYCQLLSLSVFLEAVQAGRAEFASTLAELGFITREEAREVSSQGGGRGGGRGSTEDHAHAFSKWLSARPNRNWESARFVKAAICAGFYPNVLRVQAPKPRYQQVDGGAFEIDPSPHEVKFFDYERGRCFMHPGSVCFKIGRFDSGFVVYTSLTMTSKLFVREASMVPVYSLLLFGGSLATNSTTGIMTVDGWAEFKAPPRVAALVKALRVELETVLAEKIEDPSIELSDCKVAGIVMSLLELDGF